MIAQYVLHAYADVGPALIPEDPKQRALAALVTRVHDGVHRADQGCLYRGPMPVSKRAEDLAAVAKQMGVVGASSPTHRVFMHRKTETTTARSSAARSRASRTPRCSRRTSSSNASCRGTSGGTSGLRPERNVVQRWRAATAARSVLGEIRAGLDDWHDAGRWEKTGVLEAVKDDTYTWKY